MTGVAVWGLGPHAFKNVLPAIAESESVTLVGCCSRSDEHLARAHAAWGGERWRDAGAMFASPDVAVVYIATASALHYQHALAALEAGKHVICEKSLTLDLTETQHLVTLARASGLICCEVYPFEYHPRTALLRQVLAEADFGTVRHVACAFTLPPLAEPGFRTQKALGGSALFDVGCYPLAMVRTLLGSGWRVLQARVEPLDAELVDTAGDASLVNQSGARADVVWAYDWSYAADLVVRGEGAILTADRVFAKDTPQGSHVIRRNRSGVGESISVPQGSGFSVMFETVVAALEDAATRELLLERALTQAELLDAVFAGATR